MFKKIKRKVYLDVNNMNNKLTIFKLLKRNYKFALLIMLLTIVVAFLSTYPINLIQDIVDVINNAYTDIKNGLEVNKYITPLVTGVVLYLAFQMGHTLLNNLNNYVSHVAREKIAHQVRVDIYKHLDSLPQDFFDSNDSSELLNKLIQDSNIIVTGFISPVIYLSNAAFSFIFGFYFMWNINPKLTLIILPFAIIASLITSLSRGTFRKLAFDAREKNGVMWREYQESIRGIRDVHATSQELTRQEVVTKASNEVVKNSNKVARFHILAGILNNLGFIIVVTCMMFFGGMMIIKGEDISIGGITAIMMYNGLLSAPVNNIISMCIDLFKVNVSLERVNKILTTPIDESYLNINKEIDVNTANKVIEINDLSFKYNNNKEILNNFSFEVFNKQKIGLVGETGSGKTTLLKLIFGLYPNYKGNINLFENELNIDSKCALRKHISYVFQDTFLFNATIKENILFANSNATNEELEKVIKISCVDEIINKLPKGINTLIGENGVKLSGGERQRVGVARALIRNPKLLLLDEATSALDNITEKKMMDNIKENYKDLTIVMVAHRLSTIEDADCIYLLDNGKIKEKGTHQELLNLNSEYKRIHDANINENYD